MVVAMRATRRVPAMQVRQRIAKKKSKIERIDITQLPKDAMLKVRTKFSIYWVVVVDPVQKEVAVSTNSASVPNGPDMHFFEGATTSPNGPRTTLNTDSIMVGASMAFAYKKPRPNGDRFLDTSLVQRISLVANAPKAKAIVDKAMAALGN